MTDVDTLARAYQSGANMRAAGKPLAECPTWINGEAGREWREAWRRGWMDGKEERDAL